MNKPNKTKNKTETEEKIILLLNKNKQEILNCLNTKNLFLDQDGTDCEKDFECLNCPLMFNDSEHKFCTIIEFDYVFTDWLKIDNPEYFL